MSHDIRVIARRIFDEVWNQGRLDVIDEVVTPDFRASVPLIGEVDRDGMRKAVAMFRQAFPDLRFTLREVIDDVDKAIVYWSCVATNKGSFMGMAPTGKQAVVEGFTLMEQRDGLATRNITQYDVIALFQALGIELPQQMPVGRVPPKQPELRH